MTSKLNTMASISPSPSPSPSPSSPAPSLPPLLPSVATTLASPAGLTSWVSMASTLDGRDKITKTCAYSARLIAWYYAGSDAGTSAKFGDLKTHLTMSRKAFRIGKFLNEFEKIRVLLNRPTHDPDSGSPAAANSLLGYQKALMIAKCAGLAGFWTAENILLLTRGSSFLYRDDPSSQKSLARTAQHWGARAYLMGAVAFLVQSVRDLVNHEKKIAAATSGSAGKDDDEGAATDAVLKALQVKKFSLMVSLTKSVCDCIVFSNITGVDLHRKFRGKPLSEAIVCMAGLGSAATVLFNNYPKAK